MSQLVLFEDAGFAKFLPLTYWRCVFDLRCGRKSLLDNASCALAQPIEGVWTRSWIAEVSALRCQIPANRPIAQDTVLINGRWLMTAPATFEPAPFVATCGDAIAYIACDAQLAERLSPDALLDPATRETLKAEFPSGEVAADLIEYPWDLVDRNGPLLYEHWSSEDRATDGKVSSSAVMINADHIHVGERSEIRPTAVIDASKGPVYISNDVFVDAHTFIEGPAYIGPGCIIQPHATIRDGTSLGSLCKIGGELQATIIAGYTNKQHHGFLGHSYVGSWANLSAGTSCGNLRSGYDPITVHLGRERILTDRQFLGAIIGDFVRTGVGQVMNNGAVMGFGAMIANGGFAPRHVPTFHSVSTAGVEQITPDKLVDTGRKIMARRRVDLSAAEETLIRRIPELAEQFGV